LRNVRATGTDYSTPVLVLGSGVTALGVCRTLGRARIPNYLVNADRDFANRSRWVDPLQVVATESADVAALVDLLSDLELERAVLMPCSDRWSNAVAGLPDSMGLRFPASVSTGRAVEVLTDKNQLREYLEYLEVPGPRTIPVHGPEDLAGISDEEIPGFFLKPRDSQSFSRRFRRKAFTVTDRADAIRRLQEMSEVGLEAVFQEYVVGPMDAHYFIDGFVDRYGQVKALFARRRLLMFPVDFGNSTLMVSVPLDEIMPAVESLRRLLAGLDYRGIFNAEFKRDERDGLYKLLEVNVRPWWFVEFAALSGVDVVTMAYLDALDREVEPVLDYEPGLRHMMFAQHLRALLALRPEGRLTLQQWLRESRGASDAVFRWNDPMPGVGLSIEYLKKALKRSGVER
jgi:predicted ATP-grasp superfamily ATP-dependent carboligase